MSPPPHGPHTAHIPLFSLRLIASFGAAALALLADAPTHAADPHPLCGTTLTSDLVLTEDLDCTGYTGVALTVGADGVIIDGQGHRLLAPDASQAIAIVGHSDVTVRNITLSGWCVGVGLYAEGADGLVIDDVSADGRSFGADIQASTGVTLRGFRADAASTAGLRLQAVQHPIVLEDLALTNNLVGLRLHTLTGPLLLDTDAIATLAGNDISIWFEANNSGITVRGIQDLDGWTYGIQANAVSNSALTFDDVDVSTRSGNGTGIWLGGAGHRIQEVTANGRQYGVYTDPTTDLVIDDLHVARARSIGLYLGNPGGSPTLTRLHLTDSLVGLAIHNFNPATSWRLGRYDATAGSGAIASLAGCETGLRLTATSNLLIEDLTLDNPVLAIDAAATSNHDLVFRDLILTSARGVEASLSTGLHLGGARHLVEEVTAARRFYGVFADQVSDLTMREIQVHGATSIGLYVNNATGTLVLDQLSLTHSTFGLYLQNLAGTESDPILVTPYDPLATRTGSYITIATLAGSDTGMGFANVRHALITDFSGAHALANRTAGVNASGANNANLHFEHVDFSGPGAGIGLRLGGSGHQILDAQAHRRTTGFSLTAPSSLVMHDIAANGCSLYGLEIASLGPTHTAPDLQRLDLRHNANALKLTSWTLPTTFDNAPGEPLALVVDGSDLGIEIASSSDLTFENFDLSTRKYGIWATTGNTRLTFRDITLTGTGNPSDYPNNFQLAFNYGFTLQGADHLVERVAVNRFGYGLRLALASNLILRAISAHRNVVAGLYLAGLNPSHAPPTLDGLDLRDNGDTGLYLDNIQRPLVIDEAAGLDVTGCTTGVSLGRSSGVTLRGLTLDNPGIGIDVWVSDDTLNATDNTFEDLTLSGPGAGTGLQFRRASGGALMQDMQLLGLTIRDRASGIVFGAGSRVSNTAIDDVEITHCQTGIIYNGHNTTAVIPPALDNVRLAHNELGLSLVNMKQTTSAAPFVLDPVALPAPVGNDRLLSISGSAHIVVEDLVITSGARGPTLGIGIVLSNSNDLTLRRLTIDSWGLGIHASNVSASRFETLTLSGHGAGVGMQLGGADNEILGLTVHERETGLLAITASNLHIAGLVATGNGTGLRIQGAASNFVLPTLTDLDLDDNGIGLDLDTLAGTAATPFAIGPTQIDSLGNAISGCDVGVRLTATAHLRVHDLRIEGRAYGIQADAATNLGLRFEVLDLSGNGHGYGLRLRGADHRLTTITAHDRQYGVELVLTSNPTLDGMDAGRAWGAGLLLTSTTLPLSLTDLALTDSALGLSIATVSGSGSVVLDGGEIASLAGDATAITITGAPQVTVDTAALGLTPSGNNYLGALPPSDPLCGTTLTDDLLLAADLDCRGTTGIVFTIGDHDVTLDGNGFKILAPHASRVVSSNGWSRLTVRDLDVSGAYAAGIGVDIGGGTGHVVQGVFADRRQRGVWVADTSALTMSGVDARQSRTTGVQLETLTLPLTLSDLDVSGGLATGLSIAGLDGAGPGGDLVIDGTALTDLAGNDTSLALSNVSDVVVRGPIVGLDGTTAGIVAASGNVGLSFEDLDLSVRRPGVGRGLDLVGDGHRLIALTAHRRSTAFDVRDGAGLVLDDLAASYASVRALNLENTPSPSLTELRLTDSAVALRIADHAGSAAAPLVIAPFAAGAGAIADLSGSAIGIQILRSSHLTFTDLALDNVTAGISALDAGNANLVFSDLDLTGSRPAGVGLELGGDAHLLEDLDVGRFAPEFPPTDVVGARRGTGVSIDGASGVVIRRLRVDAAGVIALSLQNHDGAPLLGDLSLTRSGIGLRINELRPPSELVIGPYDPLGGLGAIRSLEGCLTGLSLSRSENLALVGLVIPARDEAVLVNSTTSSLRFEDLDLDGVGRGRGLRILGGAGHRVIGVDVSDRPGAGVEANNVSDLEVTRLTVDRSGVGLRLTNATMPLSLTALTLTNNHTGLELDGVVASETDPFIIDASRFTVTGLAGSNVGIGLVRNEHVHVRDLHTLDNPGAGVHVRGLNTSLVLQRLTVSGHGRGIGIHSWVRTEGLRFEDVIADRREVGFALVAASGLVLERARARMSSTGLSLRRYALTDTPPALSALDLRDNLVGLLVSGTFQPWTIAPALDLDLADSAYGIQLGVSTEGAADVTVAGFIGAERLPNRLGGISAANTNNRDLVISDVDVSGQGVGSGLALAGTDHRVEGLVADDRNIGVDAYARALTLRDITAGRSNIGVQLQLASPSFGAPTFEGLALHDNSTALAIWTWTLPFTFGPSAGLEVTGSKNGISITGTSSDLTFEGPLSLPATSFGITMSGTSSRFTFRGLDLSGRGQGVGIAVQGSGHTLEGLVADDRATGVQLTNTPGVILDDIAVARASTSAVRIAALTEAQAPPQLSDLRLRDSAVGLLTDNVRAPLDLDTAALTQLSGNRVGLSLFGTETTVSGFAIASTGTGVQLTSTSPLWGSHSLAMKLDDLVVDGFCRGTGIDINNASYTTLTGVEVARFATGISVGHGDGTHLSGGVIGANTTGLAMSGGTAIPSTVVRSNVASTTTQIWVSAVTNLRVGMPLRFAMPTGDEERTIQSIQVSSVGFTLTSPLSAVPPPGTTVRGLDYGTPRLVVETSDICANGTGMSLAANESIIDDDYWRASDGPEHATLNPSGSGDLVTGTHATLTGWLAVPSDKDNPYCNQAPLPEAGDPRTVCQGDLVTLDASASIDPDVEPLSFAWTQIGGVAVQLESADQPQATFTAPAPAAPGDDSEVLSFQVHVADDEIERSDTVTITTTRGHEPPSADAGSDQTVMRGSPVSLTGSGSDPEAQPLAYAWVQSGGPAVTLVDADQPNASFTAPAAAFGAPDPVALTFLLTVGDTAPDGRCGGVKSAEDAVTVTIVCPDSDGDQTSDCQDACPLDPNKVAPGPCGCGIPEEPDGTCGAACGNGVVDAGEGCDPVLDDGGHCDASACQCGGGYGPDGDGGCAYCGDALVNGPETCEDALDVGGNCAACQCGNGYPASGDGGCGYCGDGALAEVEACDDALDTSGACVQCACSDGWVPAGSGGCAFCGEGTPSCATRVVFGVAGGPQGLRSFRCERSPEGDLSCVTDEHGSLALSEELICQ